MVRESRVSFPAIAWPLLAALVLGAPHARAAGDDAVRVVVDVSGGGDPNAILARFQEVYGEDWTAHVVHVDVALDRGFGPWSVSAPAALTTCSMQPMTNADLAAGIEEAHGLLKTGKYADIQQRLERLERRLCAATEVLSAGDMARLSMLIGAAAAAEGRESEARTTFMLAVQRQMDLSWDDSLPAAGEPLFDAARAEVKRSRPVTLALDPTSRPATLFVDGTAVPADATEVTLRGEDHVVQIPVDQAVRTVLLKTHGADLVTWIGPSAVTADLDADPSTARGMQAFTQLSAAAAAKGATEIDVLLAPDSQEFWQYTLADPQWRRVSLALTQRRARSRKIRMAGAGLVAGGAVTAVIGGLVIATQTDRGNILAQDMLLDTGLYDLYEADYEAYRDRQKAGAAVAVAGGVLMGVGLPMLLSGGGSSGEHALRLDAGPGDVGLGVTGRF